MPPFAAALKELRKAHGLSQAAVAERAGVSTGYVGLLEIGERGSRPSYDVVKRFARAVSASVEETERLMRAAGHLGPSESLWNPGDDWSVEKAIETDPLLDNDSKAHLIGIYLKLAGKVVYGTKGSGKTSS